MNITTAKNCIKVGQIVLGTTDYIGNSYVLHKNALKLIYDENFPKHLKNEHLALVYLFVINNIIYKIGQSSAKNGIAGCMSFYLKSGQDDPGSNRFFINLLIREELEKGNKVEVYMAYMDLIEVKVLGLTNNETIYVPISAKGIEEVFMKQYFQIENKYPKWNHQENNEPIPSAINWLYYY
jgi:hypothetical protein